MRRPCRTALRGRPRYRWPWAGLCRWRPGGSPSRRCCRARLDVSPVLAADLEEGVGDLSERADACCGHEFGEHVAFAHRDFAQSGEGEFGFVAVAGVEV